MAVKLKVGKGEGERCPRWYLPVNRDWASMTTWCWLFPLAPFVLVFGCTRHALWLILGDVRMHAELMRQERRNREGA